MARGCQPWVPSGTTVVSCVALETGWSPQARQDVGQRAELRLTRAPWRRAIGFPYAALLAHDRLQVVPVLGELGALARERRTCPCRGCVQECGASAQRFCLSADVVPCSVCPPADPFHAPQGSTRPLA